MISDQAKQIRKAIDRVDRLEQVNRVRSYFAEDSSREGRFFSTLGAPTSANEFTAADLLATTMLSVPLPATATATILITESDRFNELLQGIPEKQLEDITNDEYESYLGRDSCAWRLWQRLRRTERPGQQAWGIGPTRASKILARKRPQLFPIEDTYLYAATGLSAKDDSWRAWWEALTIDDLLVRRAEEIRKSTGYESISTLRIWDVVLWEGEARRRSPLRPR